MAQDLKLQIMLKAVDKVTRPLRGIIQTAEKLRGQMVKTGSELKNLEGVQRTIDGHRKLQQRLGSTASKMDQVQQEVAAMGRAIAATDNPSKRQLTQFARAKQQLGKLKTAHRGHKLALSAASRTLQQANIDTRNLSNADKKLAANIATVNQRMTTQARKLGVIRKNTVAAAKAKAKYDKAMQRQANLSFVGAAGFATGTKALQGVASMIQPGIAFEEQMSSVGALTRISKSSAAFKKMQAQARQLGESTSFSATEAAQGMQKLAMAGFDANKIMATMPGMLDLAKAGVMDLGATADIASNILSAFKLPASEMNRVSDVLAATFSRSNVDLEMLGETLKYTAPIAQEFGASIEEAAALTGLLGSKGIQGSMAGTAMRTMYNNIATHGPAMDALKELGIATRDAHGNMIAMPEILGEVAKKTEKLGAGDRLSIFKDIAGKQAGAAFASLVGDAGAGGITKFIEVLENARGEAKRIAAQMGDNTSGDLKSLESAWEAVKISIFSTNSGPIRDLIQHITTLTRKLNAWVTANPQLAGQLLKVIAVGGVFITAMGAIALTMASILGPLAMLRYGLSSLHIIGLVSKLFGGLIWVLTKMGIVAKIVTATQWLLNIAMNANPIGLVIAAVAGLIAIGVLLYKNWDDIIAWFGEIFDWLKSKFDWISTATKAVGSVWDAVFGDDSDIEKTVKITEKATPAKPIPATAKKIAAARSMGMGVGGPSPADAQLQAILAATNNTAAARSMGIGVGGPSPADAQIQSILDATNNTAAARNMGIGLGGTALAGRGQMQPYTPIQPKPAIVQHVTNTSTPNITIHATPGMDERALALAVTQELENQQRQQASRQNAQLYDGIY